MRSRGLPAAMLAIALAGFARYAGALPAVDAIGLFACGLLAGVSVMRLLLPARSGTRERRHLVP